MSDVTELGEEATTQDLEDDADGSSHDTIHPTSLSDTDGQTMVRLKTSQQVPETVDIGIHGITVETTPVAAHEQEGIALITEDGQQILASYVAKDDGDSMVQTVEGLMVQGDGGHSIVSAGQEMAADQDGATWSMENLEGIDQNSVTVVNQNMSSPVVIPGGAESDQLVLSLNQVNAGSAASTIAVSSDLQSLLSSGVARLTDARGEPIHIITLASGQDAGAKGLQVIGNPTGTGSALLLQTSQAREPEDSAASEIKSEGVVSEITDALPNSNKLTLSLPDGLSSILMPPPLRPGILLAGLPPWAARLHDCEKIGDAYRGWVETEIELDLLLTLHKQQTHSFWGTRQSPSPAKQSMRLMWKSQYVPFDGIPFVNAGSRAIVMECQFGPRRKGSHGKKLGEPPNADRFRQTCPARIYIKKARKFLEHAVNLHQDKKTLKMAMDKAFQTLKEQGIANIGHERFYVQLPTEEAHEFHSTVDQMDVPLSPRQEAPQRLDPRVAQKIREVVAGGESRLYAVRKALRRFVEKELFQGQDETPEKHNLSFFPTVNDLQNHIHQAIKDIEGGVLPITAQTVNVEVVANGDGSQLDSTDLKSTLWQSGLSGNSPHAETVTVTLTQNPGEDGQHIISKVETHLSDGSTQISTTLTPETARLLAKLHPNMFPASGLLQVTLPYLQEGESPQPVTIVNDDSSSSSVTGLDGGTIQEDIVGHTPPELESTVPIYGVMEHGEGATVLEPMEVSMVEDNDVIKVELDQVGQVEAVQPSGQETNVIDAEEVSDETGVLIGAEDS